MVLLFFICLRQSISLHKFFALDNQRSDNEAYVIQSIGYELYSEYDLNKTVIFSGLYNMGNNINSQIYPNNGSLGYKVEEALKTYFGYKNVNVPLTQSDDVFSILNWAHFPFHGQEMYQRMLSYYGYDVNVSNGMSYESVLKYTKIAEDNNMKPFEIREFDDYILVYLGRINEYSNWYN